MRAFSATFVIAAFATLALGTPVPNASTVRVPHASPSRFLLIPSLSFGSTSHPRESSKTVRGPGMVVVDTPSSSETPNPSGRVRPTVPATGILQARSWCLFKAAATVTGTTSTAGTMEMDTTSAARTMAMGVTSGVGTMEMGMTNVTCRRRTN